MIRRKFLAGAGGLALVLGGVARAGADEAPKEIRIGYQKTSALLVTKALGLLEKHFAPQGISVKWVDFQFGPPLLEALNAGAIDYGYTGDAPPIFAQAAKAKLLYVAAIPARGDGQAILVPANSPIKTLADLKGKKIGFAKGSSAHNLLVASIDSAKIGYERNHAGLSRPRRTPRRPFPAAPSTPGRSGIRSTPSRKSARTPGRCRSTSR